MPASDGRIPSFSSSGHRTEEAQESGEGLDGAIDRPLRPTRSSLARRTARTATTPSPATVTAVAAAMNSAAPPALYRGLPSELAHPAQACGLKLEHAVEHHKGRNQQPGRDGAAGARVDDRDQGQERRSHHCGQNHDRHSGG